MSNIYQIVYCQPLYRIIMAMTFSMLIWGYFGYKANGKKWWQLANGGLCVLIIVGILGATILTRSGGIRELRLMPFRSFAEAKAQPELYRSMLMNVFLFFYFGLTMPFVLPDRVSHKLLLSIITGMLFSVIVESLQFVFQLGRCETDDVIMNTVGTVLGIGGYIVAQRLHHGFLEKLKNEKFDKIDRKINR